MKSKMKLAAVKFWATIVRLVSPKAAIRAAQEKATLQAIAWESEEWSEALRQSRLQATQEADIIAAQREADWESEEWSEALRQSRRITAA